MKVHYFFNTCTLGRNGASLALMLLMALTA